MRDKNIHRRDIIYRRKVVIFFSMFALGLPIYSQTGQIGTHGHWNWGHFATHGHWKCRHFGTHGHRKCGQFGTHGH